MYYNKINEFQTMGSDTYPAGGKGDLKHKNVDHERGIKSYHEPFW